MRAAKYGNRKTVVDGITFASAKEARRAGELKLMQRAGEITDLELQPRFKLEVNGQLVTTYTADFRYRTKAGAVVIEEVKSPATAKERSYRMAMRLLKALTGIEPVVV